MNLKKTTEKSSDQLRGIATGVLLVGIILGGVLLISGIKGMLDDSGQSYRYRNIFSMLFSTSGFGSAIIGLIIMFWHYVCYVMISAYATIVENSDRSDVVDALLTINDSLRYSESDRAYQEMMDIFDIIDENRKKREYESFNQNENKKDIINKAVDEVRKKQVDEEDIELEKIDISDINIEK